MTKTTSDCLAVQRKVDKSKSGGGLKVQMKHFLPSTTINSYYYRIATVALAAVIFVFDTMSPFSTAAAVLYVVVVLMSDGFCHRRGVLLVAWSCAGLTVLSYILTVLGYPEVNMGSTNSGTFNLFISLLAIGATTYLVLTVEVMDRAEHQARTQLAHFARVTTLGELAASIAHEVSQPIAAARNNAASSLRFLCRNPPDLAEVREALDCVVDDIDRASKIIGRIRSQIKKAPEGNVRFDINNAINELVALTRYQAIEKGVTVRVSLAEALPPIQGDGVQVQQVILNLILNAVEAMNSVNDAPRELSISTERRGADAILVAVRDSGPGIDPEHLERVFDAFYTTKPGGMGLGLSICRSIIEAHGGRLWVDADANQLRGATFQFALPATK